MKKIILILILGLFLISLVSAESLGTVTSGDCISLYQYCPSCSYVNLTAMKYPNETVDVSLNEGMTQTNSNYNYTFCSTNDIGDYFYTVCGDKDGVEDCEEIPFESTTTGTILKTSDSMTYFILTIGVLFFFLLCLYGGLVLPFRNERNESGKVVSVQKLKYFKLVCLFTSYILFVWLANLLFALANNFNVLGSYTKFFEVIFSVVNSFSYAVFVLMFVSMLFLAWKDLQLGKLLKRGINPD